MNKCHIVLSGGGDSDTSFQIDAKFFALLPTGAKILYIPIALNRTMLGFEACYDWFSALVSSHASEKDIDFRMLLDNDTLPDFHKYDAIFIGGGNTYKLLHFIYQRKIANEIVEFIASGGVVYGGSAGAIILGKDIRTVEEENDKDYIHSDGLNLLGDRSVICHYTGLLDDKVFQIAKKIDGEIIALPEHSGIICGPDGYIDEIVGEVFIFNHAVKKRL